MSCVLVLIRHDFPSVVTVDCLLQVSVSCGIPDFRSRDGIYARLAVDFPDLPDPQAMFDIHYFRRDPRPFFKFAREIYPGQFTPSLCHRWEAVPCHLKKASSTYFLEARLLLGTRAKFTKPSINQSKKGEGYLE